MSELNMSEHFFGSNKAFEILAYLGLEPLVTAATTMVMLATMVSMAMMVMMAAAWKRLVAVVEVVVTGVAMAAAMHLADYHW